MFHKLIYLMKLCSIFSYITLSLQKFRHMLILYINRCRSYLNMTQILISALKIGIPIFNIGRMQLLETFCRTQNEFFTKKKKMFNINLWVKKLLRQPSVCIALPPTFYCEKSEATNLCANPQYHSRM